MAHQQNGSESYRMPPPDLMPPAQDGATRIEEDTLGQTQRPHVARYSGGDIIKVNGKQRINWNNVTESQCPHAIGSSNEDVMVGLESSKEQKTEAHEDTKSQCPCEIFNSNEDIMIDSQASRKRSRNDGIVTETQCPHAKMDGDVMTSSLSSGKRSKLEETKRPHVRFNPNEDIMTYQEYEYIMNGKEDCEEEEKMMEGEDMKVSNVGCKICF